MEGDQREQREDVREATVLEGRAQGVPPDRVTARERVGEAERADSASQDEVMYL